MSEAERVYNREIAPLMARARKRAETAGIPFVAFFELVPATAEQAGRRAMVWNLPLGSSEGLQRCVYDAVPDWTAVDDPERQPEDRPEMPEDRQQEPERKAA